MEESELKYADEIEELKREIDALNRKIDQTERKIEKERDTIYLKLTNVMVNLLYPMAVYVMYLFFIKEIPQFFENSFMGLKASALFSSIVINTALFIQLIIINTKLLFRVVFKKMFISQ